MQKQRRPVVILRSSHLDTRPGLTYHWVILQVAAALTLGAQGVVMDSGFAATRESVLSPQKKQQDPAAKGADMKQTRLHDELCATDLPAGVDALVIGDQSSMKHGIAALVEVSQA